MSANALTPRASTSPQGTGQGKLSPNAGIGAGLVMSAALGVAGTGLQTPIASHSQRSPVSPLDKDLPRPPPTAESGGSSGASSSRGSRIANSSKQPSPTLEPTDPMMMRSRRLFEPLNPYLSATDPLVRFSDLTQVAEGQWGPVFAARAKDAGTPAGKSSSSGSGSSHTSSSRFGVLVAVKTIKVEEEGSPKVAALASEMAVMANVRHEHVLATAGLFISDDTLWVEMELMERSLADILPLIEEGLVVSEPEVARFASDVDC